MSQSGQRFIVSSAPAIPTSFVTNFGTATPASNILNILGTTVPAGTVPFQFIGSGNTVTGEIQVSQAIAATSATAPGLASFNSSEFTVDANGFVSLVGGGAGIERVALQAGTSPVIPLAGTLTFNGATVAAGTHPVQTDGTGANTMALQVQFSQAIAATNAANVGLAAFNSTFFTVDANGFVSINGSGVGETITGNFGGALSPVAGNWNILGRSGSSTSGSGNTLTINSPPYSDQAISATVALNTGSFATAAITLTLPASAGLLNGDLFEFVCPTASTLIIQCVGTQQIRIGNNISSAGGTATSQSIGDSLSIRFRATDGILYATSVIGNWLLA